MNVETLIYHAANITTDIVMIGLLWVIYNASRRLESIRRELGWIRVVLTSMREGDEQTELPEGNGRGEEHETC